MSRYGNHRLCSATEATGLLVDSDRREKVPSREERRRAQDEYRKELNVQVADTATRREQLRRRIREMEHQHELKSSTYNPWGKPGSGAPLRQADGALVTNVKAYHRAKKQGLIAQDLSPNEITDNEQPFGFPLTDAGDQPGVRSPLRTSRSGGFGHESASAISARPSESAVSLSPPRRRYVFERLPPEEQTDIDRRLKERRDLEVALLGQVEEKRLRKEREVAAKRAEDEIDRIKVLRVLAEERDARHGRVRDKNLKAGEAIPTPYAGTTRRLPVHQAHAMEHFRSTAAAPHQLGSSEAKQRYANRRGERRNRGNDASAGAVSFGRQESFRREEGYGDDIGGRGSGQAGFGGDGGDRSRILLILRRLEDHGKMLEKLASQMATEKATRETPAAKVARSGLRTNPKHLSPSAYLPTEDWSIATPHPCDRVASSSLSPLFRTFHDDEDQLDRLLQRFETKDLG